MTSRRFLLSLSAATAAGLPLSLLAPATAHAIDISFGNSTKVQGSGKMVDEVRNVGGFTRLRLEGSMNVVAKPGASQKVTVHADDNILPLIVTSVEGDTLVLTYKPHTSISTNGVTRITVEFTQLTAVDSRGSGDVSIEAIKGDKFQLNLAGSGDVKLRNAELGKLSTNLAGSGDVSLQGRAADFDVNIAGSGDVNALDLQARNVKANIAGSGDARVNASDTLNGQIVGSGDISYAGNPKVSRSVVGSGEVRPAK